MTQYLIEEKETNLRLDKWASIVLDDVSRSFLTKNIPNFALINGRRVKPSYKLKKGDKVCVDLEGLRKKYDEEMKKEALQSKIIAQNSRLNIIYEERDYLIVKKPAGLVVHPGIGHEKDTLANYVKGYLVEKGEYDFHLKRAGIIHRLDMPVSGLMIFAKNRKFQKHLSDQFENHQVLKIYYAEYESFDERIVFTEFQKISAVYKLVEDYKNGRDLDLNDWREVCGVIRRDPANRKRMLFERGVENEKFRYAHSYLLPLSENKMCVLIKTGRMHQIRATLKSLGLVIKGDALYGYKKKLENGISLESVVLGFLDISGKRKVFNILEDLNA